MSVFIPRDESRQRASATGSIEDAAADWLARRHAGLSSRETEEFQHWLAADSRNASAFTELDRTWGALNEPRQEGCANAALRELDRRDSRRRERRQILAIATTGLAVAAAVALLMLPVRPPVAATDPAPTVVLRPNLKTLPDGSTVELNATAQIAVAFDGAARRVRLLNGEALFDVVSDSSRPFVVMAGDVTVRAVGTAFAVRHEAARVDVIVTEGRVIVERTAEFPAAAVDMAPPEPLFVDAGRRVIVPADLPRTVAPALEPVTTEELSEALAWRGRRIEFTGTPLLEAVELFNRQNRLQLSVADTRTGARRITGIFWSDDPQGFVRLLETGLNVKAEKVGDFIVLRE